MKSETPNLFNYATSELAQDAFICWVLAWINYEESDINNTGLNSPHCVNLSSKVQIKNFALAFMDRILNLHNFNTFTAKDVKRVCIKRQHKKIDVLVKVYFKNDDVLYLIIEDKVHTIAHSNQLENYIKAISSQVDKNKSLGSIGIYYKSGFVFDYEKDIAEKSNYKVVDKNAMLDLIDEHKGNIVSDIFINYYEYLKQLKAEEEILSNIIDDNAVDKMHLIFNSPVGQWILASKIVSNINNIKAFYNGTSYGRPWTQFAINKYFENHRLPDAIFYRIDSRKEGHYIALKQYLVYDNDNNCNLFFGTTDTNEILKNKKARLTRLRACFTKATTKLKNEDYYMDPGRISNKGKKENEIGVFFVNKDSDFGKILRFVPEFNKAFCDELKKEFSGEFSA